MPPWNPTTVKHISQIQSAFARGRTCSLLESPIHWPSSISFTAFALCSSIARMQGLLPVTPQVQVGLVNSALALVCALVDDAQAEFGVTADLLNVADFTRTAFSSYLGIGIADLLMVQSGLVYRANARSLVPQGQVGDFVYDGPMVPDSGMILVEAKGTVKSPCPWSSLEAVVRKGFRTQVNPHVCQSYATGTIAHGCTVGIGCEPGASHAGIYVQESPIGKKPPLASNTKGNPAPHASNVDLVLQNYRGIFVLLGRQSIVNIIDRVSAIWKNFPHDSGTIDSFVDEIDSAFAELPSSSAQQAGPPGSFTFSLQTTIANALKDQLKAIVWVGQNAITLPTIAPTGFEGGTDITFPDGLIVRWNGDDWPWKGSPPSPVPSASGPTTGITLGQLSLTTYSHSEPGKDLSIVTTPARSK